MPWARRSRYVSVLMRTCSRRWRLRLRGYVIAKVEDLRKAKLAPNPFELSLRGPKFARITFEEFERSSEELQDELFSI